MTTRGTLYVGNDYGVVVKEPRLDGLEDVRGRPAEHDVADLVYVPEKDALYAATHGQGVWQLKVQ